MKRGDEEFLRRCRAVHILNQAFTQALVAEGAENTEDWLIITANAATTFTVAQLRMAEADLAEFTQDFPPEFVTKIEAYAQKNNCSVRAIIDRRDQAIKRYLKRGTIKTEDEARIAMGVLADLEYLISAEDRDKLEAMVAEFEESLVGKNQ